MCVPYKVVKVSILFKERKEIKILFPGENLMYNVIQGKTFVAINDSKWEISLPMKFVVS